MAPKVPMRSSISRSQFLEHVKEYDFIRLTFSDLNGLHLTKMVPVRYAEKVAAGKSEIYAGVMTFGPRNEVSHQLFVPCSGRTEFRRGDPVESRLWRL
ncbi:unnamed protein product [Protopolystoma xenopodis]|uniref:Uncharacterized protein n=1 Tax=Protopolystoma xenopodis TaxID=117903 RepID=A0A448XSE0_9PLAT|nr:unnamed protein product [Protopolystoma xenopodis]